jgi:predicted DNA-binding transcriptional regulator AlpA
MALVGIEFVAKHLGHSKAAAYRHYKDKLLPAPVQSNPLMWDDQASDYISWYAYHPISPEGRKLYASATQLAKVLNVSSQGVTSLMKSGSLPRWDFELGLEKLWLWSLINPLLSRIEAKKNGWVEEPPEIGTSTVLPCPGEKCSGRRGYGAGERSCSRAAIILVGKTAAPMCGECSGTMPKASRQIDAQWFKRYGGVLPDPNGFVADTFQANNPK